MSDKKAAGHPDGASVCSGLAASAPSWLTSSLALIRVLAVVMVMRQPSALSAGPQTGRPRGLPVAKESSAGMFTQHCVCLALLCWLSGPAVGGAAVQTRKVLINDSQDAELERSSKHQRYQLKGIAHLAFCTKVVTGLWWWAAADKLKGYTGILACSLSATSWVHALATPYTTPTAPHRMLVVLQGCSTACANLSPASQD